MCLCVCSVQANKYFSHLKKKKILYHLQRTLNEKKIKEHSLTVFAAVASFIYTVNCFFFYYFFRCVHKSIAIFIFNRV